MGKVYTKLQKKNARIERKRRRNLGSEWDGFHGRGQRAQKYWWHLEGQRGKRSKTRHAGNPTQMAKTQNKPWKWF